MKKQRREVIKFDRERPAVYRDRDDWWIGYYRGKTHHYVCIIPTVVIRWQRAHWSAWSRPTPTDPNGSVYVRCFCEQRHDHGVAKTLIGFDGEELRYAAKPDWIDPRMIAELTDHLVAKGHGEEVRKLLAAARVDEFAHTTSADRQS